MGERIEEWKDIEGFAGLYQVSNCGRVRSLRKGILLRPAKNKFGYMYCALSKNGKLHGKKVHRLVAQAFVENPLKRTQVNHKDGNKANNNADNLEWCTYSENTMHAVNNGLFSTNCKVRIVETGNIYVSIGACARAICGSGANISACLNGKRQTHLGYHFERVEA